VSGERRDFQSEGKTDKKHSRISRRKNSVRGIQNLRRAYNKERGNERQGYPVHNGRPARDNAFKRGGGQEDLCWRKRNEPVIHRAERMGRDSRRDVRFEKKARLQAKRAPMLEGFRPPKEVGSTLSTKNKKGDTPQKNWLARIQKSRSYREK